MQEKIEGLVSKLEELQSEVNDQNCKVKDNKELEEQLEKAYQSIGKAIHTLESIDGSLFPLEKTE